jgi:hypothetical protein
MSAPPASVAAAAAVDATGVSPENQRTNVSRLANSSVAPIAHPTPIARKLSGRSRHGSARRAGVAHREREQELRDARSEQARECEEREVAAACLARADRPGDERDGERDECGDSCADSCVRVAQQREAERDSHRIEERRGRDREQDGHAAHPRVERDIVRSRGRPLRTVVGFGPTRVARFFEARGGSRPGAPRILEG